MFDRVKEISKKRGLSLAQLNEKAGFKQNVIYSWKTKTPSIDKVESVAKVLGVSVDYLLGKDETRERTDEKDFRPKVQKIARKASHLSDNDLDKLNDVMAAIFKDKFDD
ncbi:helix-turn-helix domain-containing protein [Pediococcus pentosaceus]|nr:helix-turn-helix domain-containing protein [Pediococcus pentosaceus]